MQCISDLLQLPSQQCQPRSKVFPSSSWTAHEWISKPSAHLTGLNKAALAAVMIPSQSGHIETTRYQHSEGKYINITIHLPCLAASQSPHKGYKTASWHFLCNPCQPTRRWYDEILYNNSAFVSGVSGARQPPESLIILLVRYVQMCCIWLILCCIVKVLNRKHGWKR